jgi:hypothetical protein
LRLLAQVGDFNGDELEFASQEGITLYLPRDNHCQASADARGPPCAAAACRHAFLVAVNSAKWGAV